MSKIGKRRVLFNHDEKSIKKLVDKINSVKPFDYYKVGKGQDPYCYVIRDFAYPKDRKHEQPYHDPDSIIAAVIEQELARFVKCNLWADMHNARRFRTGKIDKMPKSASSESALELYDAYVFFTKKRDKMAKENDVKLRKWAKMMSNLRKEVVKEFKAKGLPTKGYPEEITVKGKNGKPKKIKVFKSPFSEAFNREQPKEMRDLFVDLEKSEDALAKEEMKHYLAIVKNLRHMWI